MTSTALSSRGDYDFQVQHVQNWEVPKCRKDSLQKNVNFPHIDQNKAKTREISAFSMSSNRNTDKTEKRQSSKTSKSSSKLEK